ncbi:hypothetical protein [Alteromonas sp. KUL49]|uniref:hypothetical protein n=1 Tax=Alteromonas sp. KUL49 TaxID=2480798 RepID=UPI00102F1CC7|nr:hypothetical protein [Alteromonas sp. KUL49]TAP39703.1 hypothetical protein EYS00_10255 [Alteromonas sp. KUL49]GEA11693.1 hypothetical protein KUL49_20680 [Alteromonas sp. KUL49]
MNAVLQFAACSTGLPGCALYAALSSYAVTGSLKAAVVSGITAGAGGGGFFQAALVGGLASKATGGNFGHGFWSAGIGNLVGGKIKTGNAYLNVAISAIIGGTVSKLTGGKFAHGAQTWAFSSVMAQYWGSETRVQYDERRSSTEDVQLTARQLDEFTSLLQEGKEMIAQFREDLSTQSGNYDEIRRHYGFTSDIQFSETREFLIDRATAAMDSIDFYMENTHLLVNITGANGVFIANEAKVGLNFGRIGYSRVGTTIHEIGHSVGMVHPKGTKQSISDIRELSTNALYTNYGRRNDLHISLQNNAYAFQYAVTGQF